MKTIFAVSVLAAAISTSAIAADTEWEFAFEGSMNAEQTVNFADDGNKDVYLESDEDEQEGWDLELDMTITNGPLSAGFYIDAGDEQDGKAELKLDDIIVTEGKLSFGQVGGLMSTDDYLDIEETSIGETAVDDNSVDEELTVDVGFKYEVVDGLTAQIQGAEKSKYYGAAVQYAGEADALSYVVEAEVAVDDTDTDDVDHNPYVFSGAGVSYSTDTLTAKTYLNYSGYGAEQAFEYGVSLEAKIADATLTTLYIEPSSEKDDDEELGLELTYAFNDAFSVTAGYIYTTADAAKDGWIDVNKNSVVDKGEKKEIAGDEVSVGMDWSKNAYAASAYVTFDDIEADEKDPFLVELNVAYTSEAGVEYYVHYNIQPEEVKANIAETNEIILGAAYSF